MGDAHGAEHARHHAPAMESARDAVLVWAGLLPRRLHAERLRQLSPCRLRFGWSEQACRCAHRPACNPSLGAMMALRRVPVFCVPTLLHAWLVDAWSATKRKGAHSFRAPQARPPRGFRNGPLPWAACPRYGVVDERIRGGVDISVANFGRNKEDMNNELSS